MSDYGRLMTEEEDDTWFDRNPPPKLVNPDYMESDDECFVATRVYGNQNAPQVEVLREIRDTVLTKHLVGRAFIQAYYGGLGQTLAHSINDDSRVLRTIRFTLDTIVKGYTLI